MNINHINAVFNDESFLKMIFDLNSAQEVQEALQAKDIHVTMDEIMRTKDLIERFETNTLTESDQQLLNLMMNNEGSLNDNQLTFVSGGVSEIPENYVTCKTLDMIQKKTISTLDLNKINRW